MQTFDAAHGLLQPGETGLFLLTDGRHFVINPDGSGSTGLWRINPSRRVDRVIVFHQHVRSGQRLVELFSAHHNGVTGPNEQGRYTVLLLGVQPAGTTEKTWKVFAQTGQAPVRYIIGHR
jgi:hypothetical protein